jgi:hypothetical protein
MIESILSYVWEIRTLDNKPQKNKKYLKGFLEKSCRISRIIKVRNKIIREKYAKTQRILERLKNNVLKCMNT